MRTHCSGCNRSWAKICCISGRRLAVLGLVLMVCGLAPRVASAQRNTGAAEDPGSVVRSATPVFVPSGNQPSGADVERDLARRAAQRATRLRADVAHLTTLCRKLQQAVQTAALSGVQASRMSTQNLRLAAEVERLARRINAELTEP